MVQILSLKFMVLVEFGCAGSNRSACILRVHSSFAVETVNRDKISFVVRDMRAGSG